MGLLVFRIRLGADHQRSKSTHPGSIIAKNRRVKLADEPFEIREVVTVDCQGGRHIFEL